MAFGDQDAPNRKQRIEMARSRSRSNKNFHAILSLLVSQRGEAGGSRLRFDFGSALYGYSRNA
jgi:hypothetical protein